MSHSADYAHALSRMRECLRGFEPGQKTYDRVATTRDEVLKRYGPVFSTDAIQRLSREDFTSFLYIENNHHWTGLYRKGLGAAEDMPTLRKALALLLDESKPIRTRFPEAMSMVPGLGRALASAILLVAYPAKYGVWNNTSEAALRQLGLWPEVERGGGTGARYELINALFARICADLKIDLWTLDAAWWFVNDSSSPHPATMGETPEPQAPELSATVAERFALERQLEEFLVENWDRTELGRDWAIYSTAENPEAGNQFPTDVGPIDILAVHRRDKRFRVIELKRNQSTDTTIGQILRYVGWVTEHLATNGEKVEGLVIAHKADASARYALVTIPNVKLMTYEIEFRLQDVAQAPKRKSSDD